MYNKTLKFHNQTLTLLYRTDADLSVIDEIFVDKMYRCVENIIPTLVSPILDIGAHVGLFSIYASILNPKAKIISLEPEPSNFELMKENLKLNIIKNVVTLQYAIVPEEDSTSSKTTTLYLNSDSHNHTTLQLNKFITKSPNHEITVPAITLGELIKKPAVATSFAKATTVKKAMADKEKLKQIGLLKMDIEGGEFAIFQNMKKNTWNKIQNIVVEYHEFSGNKRAELENIIRSHGFSVEHFPNHFDKRFGLLLCRNRSL